MLTQLRTLFSQVLGNSSTNETVAAPEMQLAMASLLCEVSHADYQMDDEEESAKVHLLQLLLDIEEFEARELLERAIAQSKFAVSVYEFTHKLRDLSPEQRFILIEAMWQVAYIDGYIHPHEEAVIRQVADLIYVDHSEFIRAKLSAQEKHEV